MAMVFPKKSRRMNAAARGVNRFDGQVHQGELRNLDFKHILGLHGFPEIDPNGRPPAFMGLQLLTLQVLIVLFTVLRKLAWDYGRIGLLKPKKNKWASLFYSEIRRHSLDNDSNDSVDLNAVPEEGGWCSWLRSCFCLTNAEIQRKAGIDAVHYLRFQLYLIIYSAITMVVCLVVILPLNIRGVLKSPDLQSFGVTTISNLPGESGLLWVHTLFGLAFFLLAFSLMQHFSKLLRSDASQMKSVSYRTLMISGISRSSCQRDLILRHFREAYPRCDVEDIQVCYDIRKLVSLDNQWEAAKTAVAYSQNRFASKGKRAIMIPRCCGWSLTKCYTNNYCRCCFAVNSDNTETMDPDSGCCCCPRPSPVDAIDYYTKEADRLHKCIDDEGSRAVRTKIGIAFVTFGNREAAATVYRSYHSKWCLPIRLPTSRVGHYLRSGSWTVNFSPTPNNIIWPNLAVTRTVWWIRAVIVNICVFMVVFFLTTPTYVLNLVNKLNLPQLFQINSPFVIQFIPSIILWAVSALLPLLVYNSDRLVGHWTRSGLHLTVMAKTFTLLILMVLILPSLGLTSIPALIEWIFPEMRWIRVHPAESTNTTTASTADLTTIFDNSTTTTPRIIPYIPIGPQSFQWECVFMPDNGAFFVNYVITSAFIGTALQLARLPDLFLYACRLGCVRSQAERASVRKASQWEFDFGLYYAWTLCVFAVVSSYSILCPLITPFGLTYLVFKFLVDRYNLYYAYLPSRIDSRIHWLAITCMLFSVILLPLNLFMFISLRLGAVGSPLSIVALAGLCIAVVMWLTSMVTGWFFVGSNSSRMLPVQASLFSTASDRGAADGAESTATRDSHWAPMTSVTPAQLSDLPRSDEVNSGDENGRSRQLISASDEKDGIDQVHPVGSQPVAATPAADLIRVNLSRETSLHAPASMGSTQALAPEGNSPWFRHSYSTWPTSSETHQFIAPVLLTLATEVPTTLHETAEELDNA